MNFSRVYLALFCLLFILPSCNQEQSITSQQQPAPRQAVKPATTNRPATPISTLQPLSSPRGQAPAPSCAAVCVIDPKTGKVLYSHNGNTRRQVASTQKIMTALCVTDAGRLNEMIRVAPSDVKTPRIRMDLVPGQSYRRADLLKAMLTASYNDVAMCLARDTAGSVDAFVERMNSRARRMRMYNTRFANPHGLPAEQYSTANDMALAACYAYNNPVIRRYINIAEYQFPQPNGTSRTVKTTNKLLRTHSWVHGMKTGFTNAAGKCLISCGTHEGKAVIVVILGSTNARIWGESLKYLKWGLGMN